MKLMAIFLTGDTHGDFSRLRPEVFREQERLTKEDYVIICGDFGGIWDGSDTEQQWLDWLADRPFTTLFVDGNHETMTSCGTTRRANGTADRCRRSVPVSCI